MAKARSTRRARPDDAPTSEETVAAARRADLRELKALDARGADWNASWRNYRPLHALIQERPHERSKPSARRLRCLGWLLQHGADPELTGAWPSTSALLVAAFSGADACVPLLLEGGAERSFQARCALGELDGVRGDLERDGGLVSAVVGASVTALHAACGSRLGSEDARRGESLRAICALLLEHGADPNALVRSWGQEVDPAYFAIASSDRGRLAALLGHGADATRALGAALWRDDLTLAELCLERGARVDAPQHDGRAPLNELIRWGQVKPALWLLEHGASPDVPDERGWTALHQAASRGNERLVRALLAAGGSTAASDADGLLPLDVARAAGRESVVSLLAT